jgi:hypothetical protein
MTTAKAERSLRLLGKKTLELDRQSATSGEIFYDNVTQTLRLYDGVTVGGKIVGKTDVITLANGSVIKDSASGAISFGLGAGIEGQSTGAVAIGNYAGSSQQQNNSVAIGSGAGQGSQNTQSVAIGYQAGYSVQGGNAIAIGPYAGRINQHNTTIILSATGSILNSEGTGRLYIDPIRSTTATANVLYYNTTSKEVTYAALPLEIPTQTGQSGKYLTTNGTTVSWDTVSSFSGSYTDLTNKPTIPTNNNQLTNGAGYITATGIATQTGNSGKYLTTDGTTTSWGTVSTFSGSYVDLTNKPTIDTLAPSQTGNIGKILTTSGTAVSWVAPNSSRLKLMTNATGLTSHTFSDGPVWRHTSISGNFTANFNGVPATEGTVLTVVLQLVQGATPYMPTAVNVEGVTAGSILWFGNVSSGNANKTNVVTFTLIRSGSAWATLGEVKSFG